MLHIEVPCSRPQEIRSLYIFNWLKEMKKQLLSRSIFLNFTELISFIRPGDPKSVDKNQSLRHAGLDPASRILLYRFFNGFRLVGRNDKSFRNNQKFHFT